MALDGNNEFEELLERSASTFNHEDGKIHFHCVRPMSVWYSFPMGNVAQSGNTIRTH